MNELYKSPDGAISGIPDRGMMLAARREAETPIVVRNVSLEKIYGLPERLAI